jgi:hypothetical protein
VGIQGCFHLTHFVDDLPGAMAFYEATFGPHVFYRGYEPAYHRDGALFAVGDFVIEALEPLGPREGDEETSYHRYVRRFGSRIHSMAFYAEDLPSITAPLRRDGVRIIDERATAFTHPKDFPGLVELFDPVAAGGTLPSPRRGPDWSPRYWAELHPLGLLRTSHVTLVAPDHRAVAKRYQEAFGAIPLPEQPASTPGGEATFVQVGTEVIVEVLQPTGPACPHAAALAQVGPTYTGATFVVRDLAATAAFLDERVHLPLTRPADGLLAIDPAASLGAHYLFTERTLVGDPRDAA